MITRIQIKKFRSIDNMTIDFGKLTTFVGPNDAGKSNIVRALNLFFNGETDVDVPFDYGRDYRRPENEAEQAKEDRAKKGKVVTVEVTFEFPESSLKSFLKKEENGTREPKSVKWKKTWDKNGKSQDSMVVMPGNRSVSGKIPEHLRRHNVEYAPAIKDRAFFANLQGKIYDCLSDKGNKKTLISNKEFNITLQKGTEHLMGNLQEALGEDFIITLPDNLRPIFEAIEIKNVKGIPLDRRGDGIKIRHIPEMFDFISTLTRELNSGRGRTIPNFIWIFEEPENNLEINSALEMSRRLEMILQRRQDVQLIFTTHSPVFYGLEIGADIGKTNQYLITKDKDCPSNVTRITDDTVGEVHEKMGMFQLLSEQMKEENRKYNILQSELDELKKNGFDFSKPTIFVEGPSDRIVFQKALDVFFTEQKDAVNITCGKKGCGGIDTVIRKLQVWSRVQLNEKKNLRKKAVGIIDRDADYSDTVKEYLEDQEVYENGRKKDRKSQENFDHSKAQQIKSVGDLQRIFDNRHKIPKCLETLYPDDIVLYAKEQRFLEKLESHDFCFKRLSTDGQSKVSGKKDVSSENVLDVLNDGLPEGQKLTEADKIRLQYDFAREKKEPMARYLESLGEDEAKDKLRYVKVELEKALRALGVI